MEPTQSFEENTEKISSERKKNATILSRNDSFPFANWARHWKATWGKPISAVKQQTNGTNNTEIITKL